MEAGFGMLIAVNPSWHNSSSQTIMMHIFTGLVLSHVSRHHACIVKV
jgi:hypothetical protein